MERFASWFVVNSLYVWIVYLGVFKDVIWAGNIIKFVVGLWLAAILVTIGNKEKRDRVRVKGAPVPRYVSAILSAAIITCFAAFGWFFIATISTVNALLKDSIYFGDWKDEG